jgi:hypothetical protein
MVQLKLGLERQLKAMRHVRDQSEAENRRRGPPAILAGSGPERLPSASTTRIEGDQNAR